MMSDKTNSYIERTPAVSKQTDVFGDGCVEIDLGNENIPPSKLCFSSLKDSEPAIINSIQDHDLYINNHDDNYSTQNSPQPVPSNFKVTIGEFEKRGDGLNAYIVYKSETKVNDVVGYTKNQYETWRRFSDFLSLHGKIVEKYQAKGIVVPQPPEKSISALTKIKVNSDPTMSREVGIQRARQLERFMSRLTQHPVLRSDCDVRDFLTIDADLPKAVLTATFSSVGVKKLFKNFQDAFSKMSFHMEEGDRWFEQTQDQIVDLDKALRKLYAGTETLIAARKELAISGEEMSKALSMLSACEQSLSLSRAISALSDTTESVSTTWGTQAEIDNSKFSEPIYEYVMLISALKDVFGERARAWQAWQDAKQTLARKRDQKTMIDLSGDGRDEESYKLKMEIDETVQKMDQMENHFEELSKAIREEVSRFESHRKHDMKKILVEYMEAVYTTYDEMLQHWEKFEPIAKNIQV